MNQVANSLLCMMAASCWFLSFIFFDPEAGGDMFLRKVG
jgi:hypothetical protein